MPFDPNEKIPKEKLISAELAKEFKQAVYHYDFKKLVQLCAEHNPAETYGRFVTKTPGMDNQGRRNISVLTLAKNRAKQIGGDSLSRDIAGYMEIVSRAMKTVAIAASATLLAYTA